MKHPADLSAGDQIWAWPLHRWVAVTRVDQRPYGTVMVHLADGRTIEVYANKIVK